MRVQFHMCTSIQGLLNNYKRKKITFITDDNGKAMSDKDARKELAELLKKGHKYIPSSECEGFDPFEHGCPGHEVKEE